MSATRGPSHPHSDHERSEPVTQVVVLGWSGGVAIGTTLLALCLVFGHLRASTGLRPADAQLVPNTSRLSDDRAVDGAAGDVNNREHGSRWQRQVLVAVAITVATTLAVALITPLSDALKEVVNPTQAETSGVVQVQDKRLANAMVRVDGGNAVRTDAKGRFRVDDIGKGEHQLRVSKLGVLTRVEEFRVRPAKHEVDVGTIRVEPALRLLAHDRTLTENEAFKWVRHYDIALWIAAHPSLRDDIAGVRYQVPEQLASSSLQGASASRRFCTVVAAACP